MSPRLEGPQLSLLSSHSSVCLCARPKGGGPTPPRKSASTRNRQEEQLCDDPEDFSPRGQTRGTGCAPETAALCILQFSWNERNGLIWLTCL